MQENGYIAAAEGNSSQASEASSQDGYNRRFKSAKDACRVLKNALAKRGLVKGMKLC